MTPETSNDVISKRLSASFHRVTLRDNAIGRLILTSGEIEVNKKKNESYIESSIDNTLESTSVEDVS